MRVFSLEVANKSKTEHFQHKLPTLLEAMRVMDTDRISELKMAMSKSVEAETSVMRIIQQ